MLELHASPQKATSLSAKLACASGLRDSLRPGCEHLSIRPRDDRAGRPAVVTDDDLRPSAVTAGSEREPIFGRRAPSSSLAGVRTSTTDTLATRATAESGKPENPARRRGAETSLGQISAARPTHCRPDR